MIHSQRETFFWIDAANKLDWVRQAADTVDDDKLLQDFAPVCRSQSIAESIIISLARREVSLDELDSRKNELGKLTVGQLRLNLRKAALAYVGATGRNDDRVVAYALRQGSVSKDDLRRTRKNRPRRDELDFEKISIVARFIVDFWCGERGVYGQERKSGVFFMPPLCLCSNSAIATLCGIALRLSSRTRGLSSECVRKWVSRLRLVRPTAAPKIREIKEMSDGGLWFRP